jgi:hypothetical protein
LNASFFCFHFLLFHSNKQLTKFGEKWKVSSFSLEGAFYVYLCYDELDFYFLSLWIQLLWWNNINIEKPLGHIHLFFSFTSICTRVKMWYQT